MKIPSRPDCSLTYCLNVHPGIHLSDVEHAIFARAKLVYQRLGALSSAAPPFGVGAWFSATAIEELEASNGVADLSRRLADAGLAIVTLNGFPFGSFHGERVKEAVYRPDWSCPERPDYTLRLARAFAALLPEGGSGPISTVPVTYGPWATDTVLGASARNLAETVVALHRLEEETGRCIQLALEPEPDCHLESSAGAVRFWREWIRTRGADLIDSEPGLKGRGEVLFSRHLGLCLDMSHLAVAGEDPVGALAGVKEAGIPVFKLHLSAALKGRVSGPVPEGLGDFADPVYLHQTRVTTDRGEQYFSDLPEALTSGASGEWRVHFHMPLVWEGSEHLTSTRDAVTPALLAAAYEAGVRVFEVETYTMEILPDRTEPVEHLLAAELAWALKQFARHGGPNHFSPAHSGIVFGMCRGTGRQPS
ncbi:MAG: metabolite traffic protein EboE [Planctomycetota bacterium]|jgi:sugar phosphate isomerase/epimerase